MASSCTNNSHQLSRKPLHYITLDSGQTNNEMHGRCVRPSVSNIYHHPGEGGTGGREPPWLCPAVGTGKGIGVFSILCLSAKEFFRHFHFSAYVF